MTTLLVKMGSATAAEKARRLSGVLERKLVVGALRGTAALVVEEAAERMAQKVCGAAADAIVESEGGE